MQSPALDKIQYQQKCMCVGLRDQIISIVCAEVILGQFNKIS